MLGVSFGGPRARELKILCLGAHSDDIEIGCGGTILKLLEDFPTVHARWIVLGAAGERAREAVESANLFLASARHKDIVVKGFRDGFFPSVWAEIKEFFEGVKRDYAPDLIFTHYRNDLHQDHRVVSELTWNTFRNHLILEYEIVKYDGDIGAPNFFVPLEDPVRRRKIEIILGCFGTQRDKHWFTEETFSAMLRLRGLECNAPNQYAEAFYSRKVCYRADG